MGLGEGALTRNPDQSHPVDTASADMTGCTVPVPFLSSTSKATP